MGLSLNTQEEVDSFPPKGWEEILPCSAGFLYAEMLVLAHQHSGPKMATQSLPDLLFPKTTRKQFLIKILKRKRIIKGPIGQIFTSRTII